MHNSVQNLIEIKNKLKNKSDAYHTIKIIAVSKTFGIENIKPLIEYGHIDFGENKVQEAIEKWSEIKAENSNIKLHLIGKLQTNKVKYAVKIFEVKNKKDAKNLY